MTPGSVPPTERHSPPTSAARLADAVAHCVNRVEPLIAGEVDGLATLRATADGDRILLALVHPSGVEFEGWQAAVVGR